jgi:hypothetical protein
MRLRVRERYRKTVQKGKGKKCFSGKIVGSGMSGTYDAEQTLCQAHYSGVSVSAGSLIESLMTESFFGKEQAVWVGRMALAWEVSERVSASSAGQF